MYNMSIPILLFIIQSASEKGLRVVTLLRVMCTTLTCVLFDYAYIIVCATTILYNAICNAL